MTSPLTLTATAIVCAARMHGEHGAIVQIVTREVGLVRGYVSGGQSRHLRPVIFPGNIVKAELRSRTAGQMAQLRLELCASRAPLLSEPLPAAALAWVTMITATSLAERHPYPLVFDALSALLTVLMSADSAREWISTLARFELLLLGELGYGLDLTCCAATGSRNDLAFVSPKSGRAVSRLAARGYESRLLALPTCLHDEEEEGERAGRRKRARESTAAGDLVADGAWDMGSALVALNTTGYFIRRILQEPWHREIINNRQRLILRLEKTLGAQDNIASDETACDGIQHSTTQPLFIAPI